MRMLSMLALVTLFSCANAIPIVKVFAVENNQPPAPKPVLSDVQEMGTTRCGKQGLPGPLSTKPPAPKREEMTVLSDVENIAIAAAHSTKLR